MPRARSRAGGRRLAAPPSASLTALVTAVSATVPAAAATTGTPAPVQLRTQHLDEALGIDGTTPELSWGITARTADTLQSAYRVQAAGSPDRLRSGHPDLWDSGKVVSDVPRTTYAGRALGSRTRVCWRVQLWSGADRTSGWSTPAVFETGLTKAADWQARWITHPEWRLGEKEIAFRVLSSAGRDDLVYRIATQTTSPSYGYQVLAGNTSLGESWDGGPGQSQNHFMLGAIDSWFTGRIAGIGQSADSVGYRELLVDPAVEGDLTSASGSYRTPYGLARTDWTRTGDAFRLTVDVPAGSTAEIHVPATGGRATAPAGIRPVRTTATEAVYRVGSGARTFRSSLPAGGPS